MKIIIGGMLLPLLLSGTALAQEKKDSFDKAGDIASQPARDLGVNKGEIPDILQKAVQNPYAASSRKCRPINVELGQLNAVLGDDFTVGTEANENRTGKIAEAVGKTIVNSLIPFRGLVREISGAAPAERKLQGAVAAGIARRGYLRGLASASGCKIAPIAPPPVEKKDEGKGRK
jgi:hypothetical protein